MISGRKQAAMVMQGPSERHQHRESHVYEDAVLTQFGVHCSVKITETEVKIFTNTYTDFVLAKSIIKNRTSLPVVWKEVAVE